MCMAIVSNLLLVICPGCHQITKLVKMKGEGVLKVVLKEDNSFSLQDSNGDTGENYKEADFCSV